MVEPCCGPAAGRNTVGPAGLNHNRMTDEKADR
jgi:hypothetical protein